MSFRPVDEAARDAARRDHDRSFVLEAGAGTGKTTLLVDRIETMIRSGRARLDEIAAVTFTENAATTMKLRLRERLEAVRVATDVGVDERTRAGEALELLERAQVSTIHALCAAILQERPLECRVAPGFRTADEAETDLLFAEAWDEWLADRLLAGDDALVSALENEIPLEGISNYGERSSLRGLARALLEQRDLQPLVSDLAVDPLGWRAELDAQAARARALLAGATDGDALVSQLAALVTFAEGCRFLAGKALESRLLALPVAQSHVGQRRWWPSSEALEEGRGIAAWSKRAAADWGAARSADLHGRLVRAVLGVVALYEKKKAERGVLDFLDLLLKARDALRDRESVRRYFRERYRFVIIDEFQDTDPLQVEIAHLLSGGARGALVVVGDPKQSIYRFRRADVTLFSRAAQEARQRPGHAVLQLTQNFRSRPAILRFVNSAFATLIQESEEAGQPGYQPLDPPPGLPEEPAVVALRFEATVDFAEGEDLLRAEAAATASYLVRIGEGALEVRDPANGAMRPSRPGDVMVLVRRLTQVRHLEEALEAAGMRFTVEGGKSFFDRQEVHEVLAVLRAVDDPSDRVCLVAALRSSFFGVSDRDIVTYFLAGGRLGLGTVDTSKPGAESLGPALALLDQLHHERLRLTVPALLDHLYDASRILAALTGTRRGEGQVANLEKVATLARQASGLGVLTLRGFTRLLEERIENAREEPDLPATRPGDARTIRVLSIHKAKGLESPVVALFDTADDYRVYTDSVALWDEKRIAVGFRQGCQPPSWSALVAKERARAESERRRLLYVACTRARDWLVIPSPPPEARVGSFWRDLIVHVSRASEDDVRRVDVASLTEPAGPAFRLDLKALAGAAGGDRFGSRWESDRDTLLERAAERPLRPISATRAAGRSAPPAVHAPGRSSGRDFGGLVHRVLEWMPLGEASPARAATMAEALAPSFGLDASEAGRAAEAASRALALPVMERARRASQVWRELPLWFPEGDELIEGIVDLVFEEDGALVLVDYKTEEIAPEQALAQAGHHAPQLQLYGRGLAQATGMRVKERLVLFTAIGQAVTV